VQTKSASQAETLNLKIGEVVETKSKAEILATLDGRGELDSLPFMPEMLQFCGQRVPVYRRAIKLCDTKDLTGMHRMEGTVHLEGLRCDGQAHGGCQAGVPSVLEGGVAAAGRPERGRIPLRPRRHRPDNLH
jgi:hypothetical protein